VPTAAEKRRAYRKLHESGCFVQPNPWDVGSARWLQHLGFRALASTSSGFAFTLGRPDNAVPRDAVLAHVRELAAATDVPLNADFENGFAHDPEGVADNVRLCVATGVAGLSIEDSTGDRAKPLYDLEVAVARMRAARAAIDRSGGDTLLTARAECFAVGVNSMDEVVLRLTAYSAAGADCLFATGMRTREQIAAVVKAVAPKPVNVLIGGPIGLAVADVAALGVRRISTGGSLARAAWGGFLRAAKQLAEEGRFDALAEATPSSELNGFFREDAARRRP
jgi:2-methylisocitrate lyase-like PEP mutase family enzyme